MEFLTIFTTVASQANAKEIAEQLLAERLVACVNILPAVADANTSASEPTAREPIESMYHWNGAIESSRETALIAKTRRALFPHAAAKIREIHTYDTPCIIAWPIVEIDAEYAAWISAETSAPSEKR